MTTIGLTERRTSAFFLFRVGDEPDPSRHDVTVDAATAARWASLETDYWDMQGEMYDALHNPAPAPAPAAPATITRGGLSLVRA